jgi:hypothetical protein
MRGKGNALSSITINDFIEMKKSIIWFMAASAILIESCASQRFNVHGDPGTVVTTLDGKTTLGVIDQSGIVKIKLKRKNGYEPFLQAKAPNSDKYIPFALDYKDKDRSTINTVIGYGVVWPIGFLGPTWILMSRTGSKYDYDYLKHQNTNNDLIK